MTGLLNLKGYLICHDLSLLKLTDTTHGKDLAHNTEDNALKSRLEDPTEMTAALIIAKVLYFLTDYLWYQSPVRFFCFL